jgi:DNA-binding CsgD family transcriptional regulator/tetratricopeptide (TPR) repeat protein
MDLIERSGYLEIMENAFQRLPNGEGHSFFITGEAGIGKTSLVKAFLKIVEQQGIAYTGTCDSLFTPRPLAPLHDISLQLGEAWLEKMQQLHSRSDLFSRFLMALTQQKLPVIIVFEDVHWADEATLDFIKFFTRRISRLQCLFLLTYRDNEISQFHPLRNLSGELASGTFTQLSLTPLSFQAVEKMADQKGYNARDVFTISGGNPFYVNEILASYSSGIPDNIRNTVLSIYNRQAEKIKEIWQLLSVIPEGLELSRFSKIDPSWQEAVEDSLVKKILLINNNKIVFKHELYRRTIELFLSPFKRIELNKFILLKLIDDFEEKDETERIVHYAKNANLNELVVKFAPVAARKASSVGAHIEAAKLFLTAIEYTVPNAVDTLAMLYEAYAYECYLTNQTKNAIIYVTRVLKIYEEGGQIEQTGNSLRFLSRLWWFEGNRKHALNYGQRSVDILENQPASKAKGMAFSNMSQLMVLSDRYEECLYWGEKAIAITREINDEETYAHALNNISTAWVLSGKPFDKGVALLNESLEISLKNSYHEHAARAYTNLGSNAVTLKKYALAKKVLDEGIHYCEERDLDSWTAYMLSCKSRYFLETGQLQEAGSIAERLLKQTNQPPVVKIGVLAVLATVKIRQGNFEVTDLLEEARIMALDTMELQRIIPVMLVLLELEWLTGIPFKELATLSNALEDIVTLEKFQVNSRLYFWLRKANKLNLLPRVCHIDLKIADQWPTGPDAEYWKEHSSPYEEALMLFEGNEESKKNALKTIQQLGASAVYEKLKSDMRHSGIKRIPRGLRESTRNNIAQLTTRELEILTLLKEGKRNKNIAATLYISAKTVDHHISSILFKLDTDSRTAAVQEAIKLGILK